MHDDPSQQKLKFLAAEPSDNIHRFVEAASDLLGDLTQRLVASMVSIAAKARAQDVRHMTGRTKNSINRVIKRLPADEQIARAWDLGNYRA